MTLCRKPSTQPSQWCLLFGSIKRFALMLLFHCVQLKEMCRRELDKAESEIKKNSSIIGDYKQVSALPGQALPAPFPLATARNSIPATLVLSWHIGGLGTVSMPGVGKSHMVMLRGPQASHPGCKKCFQKSSHGTEYFGVSLGSSHGLVFAQRHVGPCDVVLAPLPLTSQASPSWSYSFLMEPHATSSLREDGGCEQPSGPDYDTGQSSGQ